jgi:hypothetical protein
LFFTKNNFGVFVMTDRIRQIDDAIQQVRLWKLGDRTFSYEKDGISVELIRRLGKWGWKILCTEQDELESQEPRFSLERAKNGLLSVLENRRLELDADEKSEPAQVTMTF